jgi:hypothetical protein
VSTPERSDPERSDPKRSDPSRSQGRRRLPGLTRLDASGASENEEGRHAVSRPGDEAGRTTLDGRIGRARGRGFVRRHGGRGPAGALVARALGLPARGATVPARLTVWSGPAGDRWTRAFGRRRWTTTCTPTATGLIEWIAPGLGLDFDVDLDPDGDRATLRLRTVRLGRRRLGRPFGLRVVAATGAVDGGLAFTVDVSVARHRLVAYEGWIR